MPFHSNLLLTGRLLWSSSLFSLSKQSFKTSASAFSLSFKYKLFSTSFSFVPTTTKMASNGTGSTSGQQKKINIGTHDGVFHCDEVLAITMLRILPEFSDAEVTRTRNEDLLKTCDIVVDVGGVFDPVTKRFDHHQRGFEESMSTLVPGAPWKTKLSSAGLTYVHYGKNVIAELIGKSVDDEETQMVYDKIYENFVEEIDAIDNGISASSSGKLEYRITSTLSCRVGRLNPSWKDTNPDRATQFKKALELVKSEFIERVMYYADDWLAAYQIVANAVSTRLDVDKSAQIIELGFHGCPWKDHLTKIETTLGIEGEIKYVIYSDQSGKWRVQGVPISPESYTLRVPLKKEWQGLRDKELQETSKVATAIFVHANGFIGGAAEREDVLKLARCSLAEHKEATP